MHNKNLMSDGSFSLSKPITSYSEATQQSILEDIKNCNLEMIKIFDDDNTVSKSLNKILICGTRGAKSAAAVVMELETIKDTPNLCIIHGDCPDSADIEASIWCEANLVVEKKFPGTTNNYLKRNIEMVDEADRVIAFWDGFSYGTAHTIAQAVMKGKPVKVIKVRKFYKKD